MFKRISLILASLALAGVCFVGCDKKADNVPAAPAAQAPAAQSPDAAPAGEAANQQVPPPGAPMPPPGAPMPPSGAQLPPPGAPMPPPGAPMPPPSAVPAPLPPVPPEAQAAVDNLLEVMTSIADAGKKDNCADVLSELKKLVNDDIRAKLLSTTILSTYPEDVSRAINEANQARLLSIAFEMAAFSKCESAPENEEINNTIQKILEPLAPDDAADAPAAAPVAPAAAPVADAPAAAPTAPVGGDAL